MQVCLLSKILFCKQRAESDYNNFFPAVLKWSEAECLRQNLQLNPDNKRAVLGGVLGQIRFPLMTVEEFAQGTYTFSKT